MFLLATQMNQSLVICSLSWYTAFLELNKPRKDDLKEWLQYAESKQATSESDNQVVRNLTLTSSDTLNNRFAIPPPSCLEQAVISFFSTETAVSPYGTKSSSGFDLIIYKDKVACACNLNGALHAELLFTNSEFVLFICELLFHL